MSVKKHTLYFNPRSDISAFELAVILLTVPWGDAKAPISETGITASETDWKRLPPPLRKYFVRENPLAKPAGPPAPWDVKEEAPAPVVAETPFPVNQPVSQPATQFVVPPAPVARELPSGPGPGIPSPQPERPVPSFYHAQGVESLYPEGQEIIPTN